MTTQIWLGLLGGTAFGFVIQRIGATDPNKMTRAHLMIESDIPKFMLMTVIISAFGLTGLLAVDSGKTVILPMTLGATTIAGLLFGVGWGLCGYCPGTTWAAAGEGRLDAVFTLLGGLLGAATFAHLHEYLIPLLYDSTSLGPLTLADITGSRLIGLGLLAVMFGLAIFAIHLLWGRDRHA
ncbi:MAG: YeeE/YedE thiosulfate transporter family protein [Thermodesulfobacteriota bacterium]